MLNITLELIKKEFQRYGLKLEQVPHYYVASDMDGRYQVRLRTIADAYNLLQLLSLLSSPHPST